MTLVGILAVGILLAIGAIGIYNRLVGLRVRADGAWSDIDVQLKRRHDLVENLVETVKGYAAHERDTLEKVVEARARAVRAGRPEEAAAAEDILSQQLRQIFVLAEAYPDLKANKNFQDLQSALAALEDAIQKARRYYNAVVRDFNTRVQSIPDVIVARLLGFSEKAFFGLSDESEASVPEVSFPS